MTKFIIAKLPDDIDPSQYVLFKVFFGAQGRYYLHKGKELSVSLNKLLEEVFRGMRGKSCRDDYSKIVKYCTDNPSVNKVSVEVILNSDGEKILKREDKEYKAMAKDDLSLNRLDIKPYKPETWLRDILQDRCEKCISTGTLAGKKTKFKFCPNCGRVIK